MNESDIAKWAATIDTIQTKEQNKKLMDALARHEAVTEWHRERRCIVCGDAFQDEGPVWCELHRLVRAALGLGPMPCGHGRGECEDSAEYKTGRG